MVFSLACGQDQKSSTFVSSNDDDLNHPWNLTPAEAVELQRRLVKRLVLTNPLHHIRFVAGIDCSCEWRGSHIWAAAVIYDLAENRIVEIAGASGKAMFPYIPGFLAFREGPIVVQAIDRLKTAPDAFLFDGQGIAHPRRLGIAAHIGLRLGVPTVGVAKSRLIGEAMEPADEVGAHTPIIDRDEIIGALVRTKRGVKPLWISPGHLIDIAGAISLTLSGCRQYRLPEPTRLAHIEVNRLRLAGK
ncbi:MAG: endonuclease V [Candidatus Riflebacteria bacterium]|nr:endonuclease V [Candidatus Riflebacteria bacterium]